MRSPERDLCELSIARAINARRAGVTEPRTPPWLFEMVMRLPGNIPARYPYEALCLAGLRVQDDQLYNGFLVMETQWLLQRGWNVDMSLMLWRNFRTAFPQLRFEPEAYRAMPRSELVKEYGETFGNVIADVCVDPDSQPVINALLFRRFNSDIDRACALAVVTTRISPDAVVSADLSRVDLIHSMTFWDPVMFNPSDKPVTLETAKAAAIFYKNTDGGTLRTTFTLHPCEIDYAHPEEALR